MVTLVEKPIKLWGAPYAEDVKTLLDTKPMPKGSDRENKVSKVKNE